MQQEQITIYHILKLPKYHILKKYRATLKSVCSKQKRKKLIMPAGNWTCFSVYWCWMFWRNAFCKQGILLGSDRAILTLCINLTVLAKEMCVCVCIYKNICTYIHTHTLSINLEFLIEYFRFWPLLHVGKLQIIHFRANKKKTRTNKCSHSQTHKLG